MILFYPKVKIFENLMKNLRVAGVLRINIWFSVPVPKIKFDPPPQGKSAFKFFLKLTNFCNCGNFVKKLNFVSTPWKIIIPLGSSVGDHQWVIQVYLGG